MSIKACNVSEALDLMYLPQFYTLTAFLLNKSFIYKMGSFIWLSCWLLLQLVYHLTACHSSEKKTHIVIDSKFPLHSTATVVHKQLSNGCGAKSDKVTAKVDESGAESDKQTLTCPTEATTHETYY